MKKLVIGTVLTTAAIAAGGYLYLQWFTATVCREVIHGIFEDLKGGETE